MDSKNSKREPKNKDIRIRILSLALCLALTAGMAVPAAAYTGAVSDENAVSDQYSTSLEADFSSELTDEGFGTFGDPEGTSEQAAGDEEVQQSQPVVQNNEAAWEDPEEGAETTEVTEETEEVVEKSSGSVEEIETFGTESAQTLAVAEANTTTVPLAKKVKIEGLVFVFSKKVAKKNRLIRDYIPRDVYVKGYKTCVKVYWKYPVKAKQSGFYVFRLNADGQTWNQIADLPATTRSFKDTGAKTADTVYQYRVLSYVDTSVGRKVSRPSDWASAVTTRSKKVNVYSITNKNPAKTAALSIGKKVKMSMSFPKKYLTKEIRWSSSDTSIASIDEAGKITGVGHGNATITGKMHTGNVYTMKISIVEPGTAQGMVEVMAAWMDYSRLNGKHKGIVDIYNSQSPLPVNYTLKYYDAWCDATVTAAAIVSGNYDKIGGECSVPRHLTIFKKKKIWEEDGTIKPKKGDLIIYNWRKSYQPNNSNASHIGIVESVKNGQITTIEGNMGSGVVGRRVIKVGYGYIRGFARPKYKKSSS